MDFMKLTTIESLKYNIIKALIVRKYCEKDKKLSKLCFHLITYAKNVNFIFVCYFDLQLLNLCNYKTSSNQTASIY